MTEIVNAAVSHKVFGDGKVIYLKNGYITVLFDTFQKEFVYPEAFKYFLNLRDSVISEEINEIIKIKEKQDQKLKEKKEEELREKQELEANTRKRAFKETLAKSNHKLSKKTSGTKKKSDGGHNIAFKCNFCDGGESLNEIGYHGVCSDEMILYNIEKKHHLWCSDKDSPCQLYHNGNMTRKELDDLMSNGDEDSTVCYECQMLKNWKASAGMVLNGENKGKPRKLKNIQHNCLSLLTTRLPSMKEEERIIFGVFLVDDIDEGDEYDPGSVSTQSEYKIKLTLKEAQKMKFWNYYFNPNNPESIRMGSGLFRYFNDDQATQILRDLVKLKEKKPEWELSKRILDHFCLINHIDINAVPENPIGGLLR